MHWPENMDDQRRPLRSRGTAWAGWLARRLSSSDITPNQISLASIGFALLAGLFLLRPDAIAALIAAALCIQLRLLCNLMDGMVAVEGGKGSAVGPLYNEIPDRIADSLILIGLGYGLDLPALGWLAALVAAITAYIRTLGGALGQEQDFRGPMAKPQRMALLTAGCIVACFEIGYRDSHYSLLLALLLVIAGSVWTCVARTRAIARQLEREF